MPTRVSPEQHARPPVAARPAGGAISRGGLARAVTAALLAATTAAIVLAHGGVARAQWIQTANATYSYTSGTNWNGGVINQNFSGFTLSANANPQTVTFSGSYNLGSSFNLAYDANTTGNLRFQSSGGVQTVSFGGLWTENVTNAGGSSWISFGINGASNLNLALTGATTFDTNQGRADRKGLAIFADISGTHAITKTGTGVLSFSGSNSYAGNLAAREGDLVVSGGAGTLRSVARISMGGSTNPTRSGLLLLDNRVLDVNGGAAAGVSNRLNDSATIAGLGNGQFGLIGASGTAVQEVTGTFANQAGFNRAYVLLQGNTGQASQVTTVTFTDVARSAGTTLGLQGGYRSQFSTTSGIGSFFNLGQGTGTTSPQLLATQIGGGSPAAANVNGIVPWAFVGTGYQPSAFATYGANGFKPYGFDATGTVNDNGGTEPYVAFASGSATSNVRSGLTSAVSGTVTFNSLTMTGGSVTRSVSTDTLMLTSGGLMSTSSGSIGIQPRLDVNGREGVIFARGIVNLSGGIVNDGGNGVTFMATSQTSGGGVQLDGTSTYTGATRINYGDVAARVIGAIPQTSDVRIDAGGSLNLWDGLSGGTVIGALSGLGRVTARNSTSGTAVLVTGSGNGSGDFGGTITNGAAGAIALTKVGSGTQTLSGSNTYTGETRVSGGVLALGAATAISSQSNLLVDGGGLNLGGYSNTVGTVTITSGSIFGSGVLTGSSYALQGGAVNSQLGTGAITVSTGTTTLGSGGRLNAASGLTISSGQLTLGGSESVASFVLTGGVLAGTGQTLTSGSAYDVQSGSVQANLGGSVGLLKSTAGTVVLSGSNTYTGQTRVSAGVLSLGAANAISGQSNLLVDGGGFNLGGYSNTVGTVTITSGSIFGSGVLTGSSYALQGGAVNSQLGTGPISVSTGTTTLGSAGRLNAASGLTISSGQLTLGGSESVASFVLTGGVLAGTGQTLTSGSAYDVQSGSVQANLGGTVGLVKSTAGTVVLSGSNTYTGPTTIAGGTLALSGAGSLAGASAVALTAAGSTFDIAGVSPTGITIGTFSGSAGSVVALGGKNLLVNQTAAAIFAGAIAGTGGFSKQGTAALTLSGTSSYTGATSVDAGRLLVDGQLGNTALSVNAGGLLGGSGSVLGSVAVLAGGTFSPGSSPGLFTAGSMTLAGVTLMEIDATGGRGTAYDAVTVTNALAYGGTMEIDFASLAALPDWTSFNLFDFGSQSGFFSGITTKNDGSYYGGLSFSSAGNVWTATKGTQYLQFTHSTGNLVIVPEPGACCTAAIGMLAAIGYAARRTRRQT